MSVPAGKCPVCHKDFVPGDDVVVCPECGAPYHRACYVEKGHCVFEDKHSSGFEYQTEERQKTPRQEVPPEQENSPPNSESSGILCRVCGTVNDARNIFCERCGAPLHQEYAAHAPEQGSAQNSTGQQSFVPPYGYVQPMDLEGNIDGISKRDWAVYVGTSAPVYISRLSRMQETKKKISFMFSAFFFSTFYFAYRKMWGWAAIAFLTYLFLELPSMLLILVDGGAPFIVGFSLEALEIVSAVASYLLIARQVLFGLFALYFYRKTGKDAIQSVKREYKNASEKQYLEALQKKGGVSVPAAVLVGVLLLVISYVLYYFFGDYIMSFVSQYYNFSF